MSANSITQACYQARLLVSASCLKGNRNNPFTRSLPCFKSWFLQVSPDIGTPLELPLLSDHLTGDIRRFLSSCQTHDLNYVRYLRIRMDSNHHSLHTFSYSSLFKPSLESFKRFTFSAVAHPICFTYTYLYSRWGSNPHGTVTSH